MFSCKSIVLIAVAFVFGVASSGVPVAAPLVAPAAVGYAHAIPQNVPPFASQVSSFNKYLSPLVAAPAIAAPLTAPVAAPLAAPIAAPLAARFAAPLAAPFAAPYAAPFAAPYAAAPYITGPGPYTLPGAYPASYATPYPYSAPLLRSPYLAQAFVR